jgi:hypothetical protein
MAPDEGTPKETPEGTPEATPEGSPRARLRLATVSNLLLWLLVLVSLLMNAYTFQQLLSVKRTAGQLALDASAAVGELQNKTFTFTVPIDETLVIETEIPIQDTISVPIQTEIPVNTSVAVMVDAGLLGGIPVRIPISTVVPVDLTVNVPLDETFPVRAPVTLDMQIPVSFVVADEPLYDDLNLVRERLDALAEELGASQEPS